MPFMSVYAYEGVSKSKKGQKVRTREQREDVESLKKVEVKKTSSGGKDVGTG